MALYPANYVCGEILLVYLLHTASLRLVAHNQITAVFQISQKASATERLALTLSHLRTVSFSLFRQLALPVKNKMADSYLDNSVALIRLSKVSFV